MSRAWCVTLAIVAAAASAICPWPPVATGTVVVVPEYLQLGTVWYVDPGEKVFPDTPVPTGMYPETTQLPFCLGGNDAVHFQIAFKPTGPMRDISLTCTVYAPPDVASCSVYRVGYTNVNLAVNAANRTGPFPDPLLPNGGDDVPAGTTAALWVRVTTSMRDPAFSEIGVGVSVNASTGNGFLAPVALAILNYTLPAPPQRTQLTDGAFGNAKVFAPGMTSLTDAVTTGPGALSTAAHWYENFQAHGLNRLVWQGPQGGLGIIVQNSSELRPPRAAGAAPPSERELAAWAESLPLVFNFDAFDALAAQTRAGGQFQRGLRFPAPYGATAMFPCKHTCTPERAKYQFTFFHDASRGGSGPSVTHEYPVFTDAAGGAPFTLNPEFAAVFKRVYGPIVAHLKANGWLDADGYAWAQFIDEPNYDDDLTYNLMLTMGRLFKSLDPSIRWSQTRFPVYPNPKDPSRTAALTATVDAWIAHVTQVNTPGVLESLATLRRTRGVTATIYHNGIPIIDLPGARLRTFPWQIWRTNFVNNATRGFGLQGSLSWYSNSAWCAEPGYASPYNTGNQHPVCILPDGRVRCPFDSAGWGFLLYPPQDGNMTKAPVSSVRWALFAQGLLDAELFAALDAASTRVLASPACHVGGAGGACCTAASAAQQTVLPATGDVVWGFPAIVQFTDCPYSSNTTLLSQRLHSAKGALDGLNSMGC